MLIISGSAKGADSLVEKYIHIDMIKKYINLTNFIK
jgi:hypothetical protein